MVKKMSANFHVKIKKMSANFHVKIIIFPEIMARAIMTKTFYNL